jgi:hypothetical protein
MNGDDFIAWAHEKNGIFSVKSAYILGVQLQERGEESINELKSRWRKRTLEINLERQSASKNKGVWMEVGNQYAGSTITPL